MPNRSSYQFKIPNKHRKIKYAIFQGGLITEIKLCFQKLPGF